MNAETINAHALTELSNQNWSTAQQLFFYNAKKNPCHQTWHNLGYYLITEGYLCKNGQFRNAHKLGVKYLNKASVADESVLNIFATITAIDYELRSASTEKNSLYQKSLSLVNRALEIKYSDILKFNALRFSYLLNKDMKEIYVSLKKLILTYSCNESISFYLELLRRLKLREEGVRCIETLSEYLDAVDKLLFFATIGDYESGYQLCDAVYKQFSINAEIAAAIIECCIGSNHLADAEVYARTIAETDLKSYCYNKTHWSSQVFSNLREATDYRRELVASYRVAPPFVPLCCYFGCKEHATPWDLITETRN